MDSAYRERRSRRQIEGPLAPYFGAYSEHLADLGYSYVSHKKKTFIVGDFSGWLGRRGIELERYGPDDEAAFLRDSAKRHSSKKRGERFDLADLSAWLRETGVVEASVCELTDTPERDRVLAEYRAYLAEERGLGPSTIENYGAHIRRFLVSVCGKKDLQLNTMRAADITAYVLRHAPKDQTFAAAKDTVTSLRSFFRFARYRDYVQTDLAASVPSVPGWSLASIPRTMPAECVQPLLDASMTWATPSGLRDHAILLLLARIGLRAREVILLELDNIDWANGCVMVNGKGRQRRPMPMPHDVGEVIATYLRDGRPTSPSRRLFLRSRAPFTGLKNGCDVGMIVRRAALRAGLELKHAGAHQLRHALAVDMLRQGLSLTEIGQVLRHSSPEATRRYAKVDTRHAPFSPSTPP
ncbi:MAG: tyrosine-type recombinase/integrase [Sphingomonadales bacterium]|nr:tyrosine-type recombinase/integrase [Sphingomonadales bacterium]MDE2170261.1 tyrosine-type recombinase/integrase [Sphingomonadales bacterium]